MLFYTALKLKMFGISNWRKSVGVNRLSINRYHLAGLKLLVEISTTKDRANMGINFLRDLNLL